MACSSPHNVWMAQEQTKQRSLPAPYPMQKAKGLFQASLRPPKSPIRAKAKPWSCADSRAHSGCTFRTAKQDGSSSVVLSPSFCALFLLAFLASIFQTAFAGVNERTFLAVKPDGVQRHLVGEIIQRFEKKGFKLVAMKFMQPSEELLKEHYTSLSERPFFNRLVKFMSSGPVVAMVWQGLEVVKTTRIMIGETNPADSKPGTIRGDLCVEVGKNLVHGSDSVDSAQREISLWFLPEELICWEDSTEHWIYELTPGTETSNVPKRGFEHGTNEFL